MRETAGAFGDFTSYYAPKAGGRGVVRPVANPLGLALNASPMLVTMLLDPRAAVHATTGVLPVQELSIPPEQYSEAMHTLAIAFTTHPVLRSATGLELPLPDEPGYEWSWLAIGKPTRALAPGASETAARDSYSPQVIEEGWLQLSPRPPEKKADTGV